MENDDRIVNIRLDDIEIGPSLQPGIVERLVQEIMASAKHHGIVIPVEVTPGVAKPWRLWEGVQRCEAASRMKLTTIPARIRDRPLCDGERVELQLLVNTLRHEPGVLQQARAIVEHMRYTGRSASQVAERLGWSGARMSKTLRLLELPDEMQQWVQEERLAASIAYELSQVADAELQLELARQAVDDGLTREATIELITRRTAESSDDEPPVALAPLRAASGVGEAVAATSSVRRFKTTVGDVDVTVSGNAITPESVIAAFSTLLATARKLNARGVSADDFFRSLRATPKATV